MPYYTYKNSKIQLNGRGLFVRGATVDFNTDLSPQYKIDNRHSFKYSPAGGIGGTLEFNYLLTGSDFVKDFIYDEIGAISGSFGGLNFQSGYLTSYRFNATPANPVSVDATVAFFDELKGEFSPTFEQASNESLLNFSDAEISNFSSGVGNLDSIQRASFTFNCELAPVYVAGEVTPREVRWGQKTVAASLSIDNLSGDLSVFGNDSKIQINLKDPISQIVKESYFVKGKLGKKTLNVSANNSLSSSLSIKQNFISREPEITSYAPTTFKEGTIVTINGQRLHGTTSVSFGGVKAKILSKSATTITAKVPVGASALHRVVTIMGTDGVTEASVRYIINFEPMTASLNASNTEAEINKQVQIDGTFFSRISSVKFGPNNTKVSSFEVIDTTKIIATVPEGADVGTIAVVSDEKSQNIKTVQTFYPHPKVISMTPQVLTELGQTAVLAGAAFSNAQTVKINNQSVGFSVTDGSSIIVTTPNADVGGQVKVTDSRGNYGLSEFHVNQPPIITGFHPQELATVDQPLTISGTNFFATKFSANASAPNDVSVLFAGVSATSDPVTGVFDLVSSTVITGTIPTLARDGKVYLYKSNLIEVHDSGKFIDVVEAAGTVTQIGMNNTTIITCSFN